MSVNPRSIFCRFGQTEYKQCSPFFDLSLNLYNITLAENKTNKNSKSSKMMKSNGLIASALLFQVILASEFEDSIYDLISNSLDGVSPEFVPVSEGPNMRMVSC